MAVGTIILGVVEDSDEEVDTRVGEGTTASITGRSRAACTSQVTNTEPLLQTNSSSEETFAAKYKVNRPRPRVVRSEMKEAVVAEQMLHHHTWTVLRSMTVSRAVAIRCEEEHLPETKPSGQATVVPGVKVRP